MTVSTRLRGGLLFLLFGCAGGASALGPEARPPTAAQAFDGVQCSAVRPQLEPDLMAWDAGERANVKSLSDQGTVVVRYEARGCDVRLEVLSNCIGDARYEYQAYAAKQRKVAHNQQELFAELPLGAATLSGRLHGGRSLRADYALVGLRTLKAGVAFQRAQLRGPECDRATHVVARVYVGGFAIAAGDSQSLSAATSVFGLGGGGAVGASAEVFGEEGVAEACDRAATTGKESAQCGVPLRLGLLPLDAPAEVAVSTSAPTVSTTPLSCPPEMATVPAGVFWMGSDEGSADEKPVHHVSVNAFCIDRAELTVAQYAGCAAVGGCPPAPTTVDGLGMSESERQFWGEFCNGGRDDRKNHPINCVDWVHADAYCTWAGKRLPTEEEWEYAARGADGRTYPWGNDAPGPKRLNGCGSECVKLALKAGKTGWSAMFEGDDGFSGTAPVGSFPGGDSPFGLHDMAGNVSEWTASAYSSNYRADRAGTARVIRGGGFSSGDPRSVRATARDRLPPNNRSNHYMGFRCAR